MQSLQTETFIYSFLYPPHFTTNAKHLSFYFCLRICKSYVGNKLTSARYCKLGCCLDLNMSCVVFVFVCFFFRYRLNSSYDQHRVIISFFLKKLCQFPRDLIKSCTITKPWASITLFYLCMSMDFVYFEAITIKSIKCINMYHVNYALTCISPSLSLDGTFSYKTEHNFVYDKHWKRVRIPWQVDGNSTHVFYFH